MNELVSHFVGGFLLNNPSGEVQQSDMARLTSLHFMTVLKGTRWEQWRFTSSKPLHGETEVAAQFSYDVVCRRSGPRLLLVSVSKEVAEHILVALESVFAPTLRKVPIAVDRLVREITQRPTVYALSYVHARVPAFGTSLKSVSFWGEDLAEASLFCDSIDLMSFTKCGLRKTAGGQEIVTLSGDGFVSFRMGGISHVLEVERVLSFLRESDYLVTELWPEG